MSKGSTMPQNHRVGSDFGTANKPSAGGAPWPKNHGYGVKKSNTGGPGNKFSSGGISGAKFIKGKVGC